MNHSYIIHLIILLFVLIANFLLIFGIKKTNKGQMSMSKKLFIFLSCADILTAILSVIQSFMTLIFVNSKSAIVTVTTGLCQGSHLIGYFIFVVISVLRFLSVKYPFKQISKLVVYGLIVFWGLFAIVNFCLNYFSFIHQNIKRYVVLLFWAPLYLSSMILLVTINILSYRILKRRNLVNKQDIKARNQESGQNNHEQNPTELNLSSPLKVGRNQQSQCRLHFHCFIFYRFYVAVCGQDIYYRNQWL